MSKYSLTVLGQMLVGLVIGLGVNFPLLFLAPNYFFIWYTATTIGLDIGSAVLFCTLGESGKNSKEDRETFTIPVCATFFILPIPVVAGLFLYTSVLPKLVTVNEEKAKRKNNET